MNLCQAFPCESDHEDDALLCEVTHDGYLEIGIDSDRLDEVPVIYLGVSQVNNLIEYLIRARASLGQP
jgi:hypothetical protein